MGVRQVGVRQVEFDVKILPLTSTALVDQA